MGGFSPLARPRKPLSCLRQRAGSAVTPRLPLPKGEGISPSLSGGSGADCSAISLEFGFAELSPVGEFAKRTPNLSRRDRRSPGRACEPRPLRHQCRHQNRKTPDHENAQTGKASEPGKILVEGKAQQREDRRTLHAGRATPACGFCRDLQTYSVRGRSIRLCITTPYSRFNWVR